MIQITEKSKCCGCTACASVCAHNAIMMKPDEEGFLYPMIDKNKCTFCGLCETVCPIVHRGTTDMGPNQKALYAARHKDRDTLLNSSSGGVFFALAEIIIKKRGVVCGVEYSSQMEVRHAFAESLEECKQFMGAKYVQSSMDGIFAQIKSYLKDRRYVLFVGTPCQVEGLNLYLKKSYETLITVDLLCHAVPSPLIFKEYVSLVNRKGKSHLQSIDMRYKQNRGWGGPFSYRYSFDNGRSICDPQNISNWGRLFFSRLIDRPSCHTCKFTNFHRSGDFTIGDFWDTQKKRPDLYSKDGTSLLLINTEKGMSYLPELYLFMNLWKITHEEAKQSCLVRPVASSPLRNVFWIDYKIWVGGTFKNIYRKYFSDSYTTRIKQYIKRILKHIRK